MKGLLLICLFSHLICSGQPKDTTVLIVDGLTYEIPYTYKSGSVTLSERHYNGAVFIIESLTGSISDYEALVQQYDNQLQVADSIEANLRDIISVQADRIQLCSATVDSLNALLNQSNTNVELCLNAVKKQKSRNRWMVAGGVCLGILTGILISN